MTAPIPPATPASPTSAVLAVLLAAGAIAVVLAGVPSGLFDLDRHAVPKELVLHLTALLGLPLLAWSIPSIRLTIPTWLLSAWLVWSGLSAIFATNHWLAWRAVGVSVSGVIIFWMAGRAARGGYGRLVLGGLGLAAAIGAATGVAQAHGVEFALLAEARAPGGTLGNRNFLAHLSAIAMPILLLGVMSARRAWTLASALTGVALLATLITLTRSRAAWLAAGVALTCLALGLLIARRAERPLAPSGRGRKAVLALGVGVLVALVVPNQLEWRSGSPYRDTLGGLVNYQEGSGRGRLIQYRNSVELVRRSPIFGTGPGNWAVEYPTVTTPGDPSFQRANPIPSNPWPSSDWVAMLAERGPIGALLLLLAGVTMGLSALRRLRDPDASVARRSAALVALLVATIVCGLFDAVLLLAPPTLLVWAAAGAMLPDVGPVLDRPLSRRQGLLAFTLLVALATSFAGRSLMQLAAIRVAGTGRSVDAVQRGALIDPANFRLQLILATQLRCNRAYPHAQQALRLFPNHPSARRAAARCGRGTQL